MPEQNRTKEIISELKKQSEKELIDAKVYLNMTSGLMNEATTGTEKDLAALAGMVFTEAVARREREMVILDATFTMLNDMIEEITDLKSIVKSVGGEIKDVKSLQEKREDMLKELEKFIDGMIKHGGNKIDKWRAYDTV